jgi:hypothetical protein
VRERERERERKREERENKMAMELWRITPSLYLSLFKWKRGRERKKCSCRN